MVVKEHLNFSYTLRIYIVTLNNALNAEQLESSFTEFAQP